MSISAPFIRRPIATSLLSAAVLLAGVAGFLELPVAPLPRTDIPTINVTAGLPGASPETMASAVATPLERRLGRIAGNHTEMTSSSTLGNAAVTLQFDLKRDVDSAARDVQAAIAAAAAELPPNLPFKPTYRKINPSDSPILILAARSSTLTRAQVYDAASSVLAQKLAQVEGVGQVTVGEGQSPAVRVQVDPEALAGVGLDLEDVRNALNRATVDQPKGALGGHEKAQTLAANDQLLAADAYKNVIISSKTTAQGAGGSVVRLGEVAHVYDDLENSRSTSWSDGEPVVLLIVRRQPGANILETNDRLNALIPTLRSSVRAGIDLEVKLDRTETIRSSVHDVERSLIIAVALVTGVVFIFLRSLRATAIPSVAIPVSLVGTFGVMWLLDFSIDNLSLMALTIATGFVVDDAIVVTENISRLIEEGEKPFLAALKGAKQIGFTIVSITLSLLAVFIPILLMGGIVGRLLREFAVTLCIAVSLSMLVSLTLTPTMCALLLRREHKGHANRLSRWLENGFERIVQIYGRGLRWVLDHTLAVMLLTVAATAVNVALFVIVPKGLFPPQDNGMVMGTSQAPQDASFRSMSQRQEIINAIVAKDPDVLHANTSMGGQQGSNIANMFIALRPRPPRTATIDEIIGRIRSKVSKVAGITLFMQPGQDLRVGGFRSRTQYTYTLQASELSTLQTWAGKLLEELKRLPELRDVATDQQTNGLQLDVNIDRDSAAKLGVTVGQIDNILYDAFGQRQVATTYTQLNQYRVVMEVKPEFLDTPDALDQLYVKSATGTLVPLNAVTRRGVGTVPLSISHQGQFPSVNLSFNLAPRTALGDAVEAVHAAEARVGLPASVHGSFTGTAQAFQESLANQPYLIAFALFTVYIVLGVLYESYIHPITILSTLPTAGIGAILALMAFGLDLSVIALIGLVLLIGVVKKNAIIMIDFAIEEERDHGKSPRHAIYEACVRRLRPILMTTAAAILGALPLALGSGSGSELRQPLGITIVGGLLFSQAFTLFTTPVMYIVLGKLSRKPRHALAPLRPPA